MFGRDNYEREMLLRQYLNDVILHFQGWEAPLGRLYDSGWEVHTEPLYHRERTELILCNRSIQLAAFIDDAHFLTRARIHHLQVRSVYPSGGIRIVSVERMPRYVQMVGGLNKATMPEVLRQREFSLADILQPASNQQLLVPKEDEKSVDDFLNSILAKQSDLRQEIAERRVKENLIERPTAQLIKLFAA